MKKQLSIPEMKVLWIVGALERLATLGILSPNIPFRVSSDAVENFIHIDNYRDILFENDFEIASIFDAIAKDENVGKVDPDEIRVIVDLILEYKNNRTEIVKHALSHQTM